MTDQPQELVTVTLTFTPDVIARLQAVAGPDSVENVLYELADHAQQAVFRPGAWERSWMCQAFGYDWLENLEPDPEHADIGWQRPKSDH